MKERPIIFSAPMVCAILSGQKTQTRRIVKNDRQNLGGGDGINCRVAKYRASTRRTICPYGQPGDRLWVRETWAETDMADGAPVIAYRAGGCVAIGRTEPDSRDYLIHQFAFDTTHVGAWRSPIHMPRWASRILLEVVSVRVERLRDISEADAMAEGTGLRDCVSIGCSEAESAKQAYELLWESIHNDGSWDANPLVWAIEFRRIE